MNTHILGRITFLLDYWLKNYCKINLKFNAIQKYTILIEKYIKPN